MDKWKIIAMLELIALIAVVIYFTMTIYSNNKEIREYKVELNILQNNYNQCLTGWIPIKDAKIVDEQCHKDLAKCKDDFQQNELLIESLQRTFDECRDGWREAIDGWDRCLKGY